MVGLKSPLEMKGVWLASTGKKALNEVLAFVDRLTEPVRAGHNQMELT
jgi:hypothetical protein